MKITIMAIILITAIFMSGCWSTVELYEDINRKIDERSEGK